MQRRLWQMSRMFAEDIGMNSGSYFSHFFKKHMGMTPQEYRDQQSS